MKIVGTPKTFTVNDGTPERKTSLVEFLRENKQDISINQRRELHLAQVGDSVIMHGFVGHTAILKRIK